MTDSELTDFMAIFAYTVIVGLLLKLCIAGSPLWYSTVKPLAAGFLLLESEVHLIESEK
jgi:hypothetical protein